MGLFLRSVRVSDPGLIRTNNEDGSHAGEHLAMVADGMGGMPAGELASDIVIQALAPLDRDQADPLAALRTAIDAANAEIRRTTESNQAHDGMGTTVTALLLANGRLGLLHVGDSRCYRLRDGQLSMLTHDDTFVQALVDQGILSPQEARGHPRRSVVTSAVQGHDLTPSCVELTPRPGDRYLLCSDGLSDVVADEALAATLNARADPTDCARTLVSLALAAGGPDNITVVIADVALR
jgi:serine/threonine protein phosphatase PrpC